MKKNTFLYAELKVSYSVKSLMVRLDGTQMAADYIREIWDKPMIRIQEQFYAVFLNRQNGVIGWRMITTGTSVQCAVDIKLLCALALQSMSCSIIIAHNHPSGALYPSKQDIAMTWNIESILRMFDIQVLDHIILTQDLYYSFVEHDKMKNLFSQLIS